MNIKLNFKEFFGQIKIPPSKSITQRVYAAALLQNGKTIVSNFGDSKDENAALKIIQKLGTTISYEEKKMHLISSGFPTQTNEINCGESGLSARLFSPIAAICKQPVSVIGSGSLIGRSMFFIEKPLEQLSVTLPQFEGKIPFTVCGPLLAKNIRVEASESSQFISGLLFALSATAEEEIILTVDNLVSKPYIDLTLEVLAQFGKKITNKDYLNFIINPNNFTQKETIKVQIESDWSSAAFWVAAACINGSLGLSGLEKNSLQADKKILEIVAALGAKATWEKEQLQISADKHNAFHTDLSDAPDLFPVLSILAACCKGESSIKGLGRLANKESNRAESIVALLTQLGVLFRIQEDTLFIKGQKSFPEIEYNCPNDHRMAMAAALVSLRSKGGIEIRNAECVAKSYPTFWDELSNFSSSLQQNF